MAQRLPYPKSELRTDIRTIRYAVRDLASRLSAADTDWESVADLARDLEACASAFACNALENAEVTR